MESEGTATSPEPADVATTGAAAASDTLSTDTALRCLFRMAVRRGIYLEIEPFKRLHALQDRMEFERLPSLAGAFGFELEPQRLKWRDLIGGKFAEPVILTLDNGNVVLAMGVCHGDSPRLAVVDPLDESDILAVDRDRLERIWSGRAFVASALPDPNVRERVGFGWFARKILAEKQALAGIVIAAVSMNVLMLSVPIFFQLLIDRVVPNAALATLYVLAAGMVLVIGFDGAFSFLRNFLLAHVQRRLDYLISCDTVQHLLSLPINYFNETPAGQVVHTVHEATNVREFLTGRVFNAFLDLQAIVLFMPLLLLYSWQLTLLVALFSVVSFALLSVISARYRREVEELSRAEGRRRALLVEIAHGISTIKTMAVEPHCRQRWQRASAETVEHGLALGRTQADARALLGGLERALTVSIGGFGALLVLSDQITVGALVAFNMIGLRLASPLIQAGSLLQDFQKAAVSLNILKGLMERAPEQQTGQLTPTLRGEIELDKVTFYYQGSDRPALDRISLRIEPGQTVGIVGRSGSGKTTVTRLLQGLYSGYGGLITFDGHDLREMNLAHLRSQIGVVLQENFLFRGTVRENIAVAKPHAPFEDVVRAAQLAGAHGFIQRLPQGYSTMLEESASNLSGGQRQRLAIARALLEDPPVLVLDEATSSLDPESEAVIQANLSAIARGRTTIIVTHRLSFVRDADQIFVLDDGVITMAGQHAQLVNGSPTYRKLWNQQAVSFR
jgi:ATP-binding cassette subfamily B protein